MIIAKYKEIGDLKKVKAENPNNQEDMNPQKD